MKIKILPIIAVFALGLAAAKAQVNSGSNGSDGALDFSGINYTTNIVIDMHDHPNGIYQYTYVNIPVLVSVSFLPNANNTPVYWLVQSDVVIDGTVNVSGRDANGTIAGVGGPGGWSGGSGGSNPSPGQGPGGGSINPNANTNNLPGDGGHGSYGIQASPTYYSHVPGGPVYGNSFILPLIGGSGGAGSWGFPYNYGYVNASGGGGGGGGILIASSLSIAVNGIIQAYGGSSNGGGGSGSGGAIRLVATTLAGTGSISAGGVGGGGGRIRFDTLQNSFAGYINPNGVFTQGFQPIIFPTVGQGTQLTITSVGGVPVATSPTGQVVSPDAVLSAQQNNPIPVVVSCSNLPLGTQITVSIKPANGSAVSAVGSNNTGTLASSTATILINIPRGGGIIYATATTSN